MVKDLVMLVLFVLEQAYVLDILLVVRHYPGGTTMTSLAFVGLIWSIGFTW